MRASQRGVALLAVLWVLVILMAMVFSFALMTRADTYGTLVFKEDREKKFLAEAGIERGMMEIIYRSVYLNQKLTLEGRETWTPDGTSHNVVMENGGYVVRITDESGKISLNGLTDNSGVVLKNLLLHQDVSLDHADIIVDSILDWKDADDLHRLHGAESNYYRSLPKPYKPRDADFEALEELVLVRGVTPEILYGNGKTKGIIRFLTIYSKAGQININAAPKEVLEALPGMDTDMAKRIIDFRAQSEIRGEEMARDLLGAAYPLMAPYVSFAPTGSTPIVTVVATGYKDNPQKGYSISVTMTPDGPHQYRNLYYKCPVEILS